MTGRVHTSTCRCSSSTDIVTVGSAASAPSVKKIFGLIALAAAIAARIVTTVRAVSSLIMEYLLFADMKILLPRPTATPSWRSRFARVSVLNIGVAPLSSGRRRNGRRDTRQCRHRMFPADFGDCFSCFGLTEQARRGDGT